MSKKDKNKAQKKLGWIDDIAEKSGYDRKTINQFLQKYEIKQSPNKGTPKRINFISVEFSGTKRGEHSNDFKFEFNNLGPGIWGIFSDKNSKGKTTALEIIKWLFKGKASSHLQVGVKSWIKYAAIKFSIDDKNYEIAIIQDGDLISGQIRLYKSANNKRSIAEFTSEEEMASAVSEFMLNELGLNQISSFRQSNSETEAGKEVIHGWPALSAALFIGTDYSALFGDVVLSGLPTRILNMFMGLPWISTYSFLKSLDGQLKSEVAVENVFIDRANETRKARLLQIQKELEEKKKTLSLIPVLENDTSSYNELLSQYNENYSKEKIAYKELVDEEENQGILQDELTKDKKRLQDFLENKAANTVFKRLKPTCCPHCESKITAEQLEKEKTEHTCSICDKKMIESDDSDEMLSELEEAVEASEKMYNSLKRSVATKKNKHSNLAQSIKDLDDAISEKKIALEKSKDDEKKLSTLKQEIFRLEVLENEYKSEVSAFDTIPKVEKDISTTIQIDENKILQAAIKVTNSRFKDLQEELLKDVNTKILDFCSKVGLNQYQNVTLTSHPHLNIEKDGSSTSYSKVSKGEQLRLKVIVTIALITVAEERGLGRHPGFLIIDSPAAQEVNVEDLNSLISGLKDLCKILPSLQIIIASVASETLLNHIEKNNRKHAVGDSFLW